MATAGPSPAGRLDELKAKNRLSSRLAPLLLAMRPRTEIVSHGDGCLEPCAAASITKVSKPVLFALKMTDLQYGHKLDSIP